MLEVLNRLIDLFMGVVREEWFWAIVAVVITLGSFIIQMAKENEISRANFIYNISNDFGNNDRILRVYQWLEECRRKNRGVTGNSQLTIPTHTKIYDEKTVGESISFVDVDTYVNHFEVVYVILRSVKIQSVDELFQQRFLSFMLNPYIQKEELFNCFLPDENDFLLMKKWLRSIQSRNRFSCEAFIDYMNTFTCGDYEFTKQALQCTKKRWPLLYGVMAKRYLINYVYYLCDPRCRYGYYEFTRSAETPGKILRIIRPSATDVQGILELQSRAIDAMEQPQWFYPSTEAEVQEMLSDPYKYSCLQICNGNRIVAFACMNMEPAPEQDVCRGIEDPSLPRRQTQRCVLDTVFVDPEYWGYGMQNVLIQTLCSWAAGMGKRHASATVHPENHFSAKNFTQNGFNLVTPTPVPKYDSVRNVFTKKLTGKDARKADPGSYTIYPYV